MKIVLLYLLFPIIAIVAGLVAVLIAKKNNLLSNKKVIFAFFLTCIVLALPGLLGFIDYWFMPYIYITLIGVYAVLGYYFKRILFSLAKDLKDKSYGVEFFFLLLPMLVGAALFSVAFNLTNELQYGLLACTCLLSFIFPSLYTKAYSSFMNIPIEVYKIWSFDKQHTSWNETQADSEKVVVVELELFKKQDDPVPLNIKAKAQEDMPFGLWFKLFINDYNIKSSASPIDYSSMSDSTGWIFYTITPFIGYKRYIDPDMTFSENKIKENRVVIAKRTEFIEGQDL